MPKTDTQKMQPDQGLSLLESSQPKPLVTFIIVAFNQANYIVEAIDGALAQTYAPLEIIISDDCSTDHTYDLILQKVAEYTGPHKVQVIRNDSNLGLARHLNAVLSRASGEIITWAAGDDIALPQRTETFVSMILDQEDIVAAHSAVLEMDEAGNPLRTRMHSDDVRDIAMANVLEKGISIVTQSCAFHRILLDRFGPFSDQLTNEGKAMAFRVAATGHICYVETPLTRYRIGTGVSTYAGQDVLRLKWHEPIKITKWYLSAYKQMLADSQHIDMQDAHLAIRTKILKQIKFYENLYKINTGAGLVGPLISNVIAKPADRRSLRAALRRIAPISLYRRRKTLP